jgi:cellulose 1,4-beta-cellobiosidase
MADANNYEMFQLLNQEFTFTVDMSNLGCGLNGALYLTEMDQDGGMARFPTNKAGAKYGTGYCDSQCPHDLKFINGQVRIISSSSSINFYSSNKRQANVVNWTPSATDINSGAGMFGTCCNEMDIWEGKFLTSRWVQFTKFAIANKNAAAFTPHVCSVAGQVQCSGIDCGDGAQRAQGLCDKDGCDFNSFRMGVKNFLGPGLTVDTNKPVTVVTQFITNDNTTTGTLTEIRRLYVQGGQVIQNSFTAVPGITPAKNSVSDAFCTQVRHTSLWKALSNLSFSRPNLILCTQAKGRILKTDILLTIRLTLFF